MKKLAIIFLLLAGPAMGQAKKLSDVACKLDGSAGCGGGGGSGDVTSVALTTNNGISGGASCTSGACSFTLGLGALTATSFTFDGTGGAGFIDLSGQASAPSSPTGIVRLYADNLTGDLKFKLSSTTGTYWHSGNLVIGTDVQAYDADLAALAGNSTDGLWAHTGAGTGSARTITGTANEIAVANGSGAGGNPTLSLPSTIDLTSKTLRVPNSTSLPGTCTVGDSYMDTDATSGARWYLCESANTWAAQGGGASGANTALSNLASVAINAALATGAGTNATLSATAPAAAASSTAGASANLTASAATAGTTNAGAAAGGPVNINAGDAARLTSGNAAGGGVNVNTGAGIGTGSPGDFIVYTGGPSVTNQKVRLVAPTTTSVVVDDGAAALSGARTAALGSIGTSAATDMALLGYGVGVASTTSGATIVGTSSNNGTSSTDESGGLGAGKGSSNVTIIGFKAAGSATSGQNGSAAIGAFARVDAANKTVIGGIGHTTLQIGSGSGTPLTRTLKAPDSRPAVDSNIAGSDLNVSGGLGTGTGGGGSVRVRTALPGTTGTAANTASDRFVFAAKPVTLTESTATLVLNAGVASGTVVGGVLWYTIRADDGTDFQVLRGRILWSGVNKAGTVTTSLGTAEEITTTSTGTLTNTVTAVANGNSIDLKLNAVSSLTQTTLNSMISAQIDGSGNFTTQ